MEVEDTYLGRWIWIGMIGAAMASFVTALVLVPDTPEREIARLHRQIAIDLPVGTSRAKVEEWLENRKSFDNISAAGDRTRTIWAQAHREYFWNWSGWLVVTFSFDEEDGLVDHHIAFEELAL